VFPLLAIQFHRFSCFLCGVSTQRTEGQEDQCGETWPEVHCSYPSHHSGSCEELHHSLAGIPDVSGSLYLCSTCCLGGHVSLLCLRMLLHCESVVELVVLPAWSDDIRQWKGGDSSYPFTFT